MYQMPQKASEKLGKAVIYHNPPITSETSAALWGDVKHPASSYFSSDIIQGHFLTVIFWRKIISLFKNSTKMRQIVKPPPESNIRNSVSSIDWVEQVIATIFKPALLNISHR
jgi:hypothetical protein